MNLFLFHVLVDLIMHVSSQIQIQTKELKLTYTRMPQIKHQRDRMLLVLTFLVFNLVSALDSKRETSRRLTERSVNTDTHDDHKVAVKYSEPWDRSRKIFPCVPESSPHTQGVYYVKVSNAASTDLVAITTRIARREAKRQGKSECKVHDTTRYIPAYVLNIRDRDKTKSFLWSMVRDPSSRAMSSYRMRLYSGGVEENTYSNFISLLEDDSKNPPNSQLRFLSSISSPAKIPEDQYRSYTRSVIDEYDYIGVYERLHESLVVLAMLIGGNPNDVLFTFNEKACPKKETQPKWLTTAMACYLRTKQWKNREMGDFILYDAASRSLDRTIEMLGRDRVKQALNRFERTLLIGRKVYGKKIGCGIPNLSSNPYADPSELPWFQRLSSEDKVVLNYNYDSPQRHPHQKLQGISDNMLEQDSEFTVVY